MTLPFYKFEFLFMQWREIRKLRKIRIENMLSFDSLKSLFSFPFLAAEISPSDHGRDRGEITARYGKSRRPKTRRDLAAILAEMREISAAKNAPRSRRDSRRDAGNLGGQKRAAISPRFSPRCGKSRRPKTRRDLAEIAARFGNLGRQIRGEMLQRDRGEIRKSRRPKRAVIAR